MPRRDYRVYLVGFVPGFAYMAEVDPRIAAPRRASPRTTVPAGSVAIAGGQTGIYPAETPGGWNIIGRTPCSPSIRRAASRSCSSPAIASASIAIGRALSLTRHGSDPSIRVTRALTVAVVVRAC